MASEAGGMELSGGLVGRFGATNSPERQDRAEKLERNRGADRQGDDLIGMVRQGAGCDEGHSDCHTCLRQKGNSVERSALRRRIAQVSSKPSSDNARRDPQANIDKAYQADVG